MLAQKKLKPGQPGTKKLLAEYGARLLCVRYRCDPERETIVKTIELIVAETKYKPRPRRIPDEQLVGVRVGFREVELQRRVRQAGGKWNAAARLWEICYDQVVKLGLTERIEQPEVPNTGKLKMPGTRK